MMCRSVTATLVLVLAGCTVGPQYHTPTVPMTDTFKEATSVDYKTAGTWRPARPSDGIGRGPWWQILGAPQLNACLCLGTEVEFESEKSRIALTGSALRRACRLMVR